MNEFQIQPAIMYDVAAIGDAFVELTARESSLPEAEQFDRQIAGAAAHISIFSSMLGGSAACIASVGADAMGTFVQNELRHYKVNVNGLQFSRDHPTSLLFSARSGTAHQTTYYRLSDWQLHNTKEHVSIAQSSRIVYGSGFSLWKHPARHSVFEILRLTKKFNSITVLQPFYEPALWPDKNEALQTIKKTLQFCDIATPTVEDAEHLFGRSAREEYLKKYHELGANKVILLMGKDGCLVSDSKKIVRVPSVEAKIEDPSGVHDAWHAGLFHGMNSGKELPNAAYFANAVAAYVLQEQGALVQLPSPDEVAKKMTDRSFDEI